MTVRARIVHSGEGDRIPSPVLGEGQEGAAPLRGIVHFHSERTPA